MSTVHAAYRMTAQNRHLAKTWLVTADKKTIIKSQKVFQHGVDERLPHSILTAGNHEYDDPVSAAWAASSSATSHFAAAGFAQDCQILLLFHQESQLKADACFASSCKENLTANYTIMQLVLVQFFALLNVQLFCRA